VFSAIACLGAAEEGGQLEFPNFDLTISLDAGSVILFPSNFPYVHIAHPVTSGIKYSMVTWFK
jgi:predicted 2-oxoglutarate/Fe(II)-dependent dioxygenase YbiX